MHGLRALRHRKAVLKMSGTLHDPCTHVGGVSARSGSLRAATAVSSSVDLQPCS
jgi:hypothetical protein